jgi:hypothetical protein
MTHQRACKSNRFDSFCLVIVGGDGMASWVAKHGKCATDQGSWAIVVLAVGSGRISQWTASAEGLIHEVDAIQVVTDPCKLADPDLNRFHCREYGLIRLTYEELRSGRDFDQVVGVPRVQRWCGHRSPPDRFSGDEYGV